MTYEKAKDLARSLLRYLEGRYGFGKQELFGRQTRMEKRKGLIRGAYLQALVESGVSNGQLADLLGKSGPALSNSRTRLRTEIRSLGRDNFWESLVEEFKAHLATVSKIDAGKVSEKIIVRTYYFNGEEEKNPFQLDCTWEDINNYCCYGLPGFNPGLQFLYRYEPETKSLWVYAIQIDAKPED